MTTSSTKTEVEETGRCGW